MTPFNQTDRQYRHHPLGYIFKRVLVLALTITALASALLTTSGCATTRKTLNFETIAVLTVQTSDDTNPDTDNRPSPVSVQIFALTSADAFANASFLALFEAPASVLGHSLKKQQTLTTLPPQSHHRETIRLPDNTRYIGILAAFNQFEQSAPRLILPITPHAKNHYALSINRLTLSRSP